MAIEPQANRRPWPALALLLVAVLVGACESSADDTGSGTGSAKPAVGVDIQARVTISGMVNGNPIEGTATASFNTRRGGSASCTFTKLPDGFTPGTINTHT